MYVGNEDVLPDGEEELEGSTFRVPTLPGGDEVARVDVDLVLVIQQGVQQQSFRAPAHDVTRVEEEVVMGVKKEVCDLEDACEGYESPSGGLREDVKLERE